MNNFYPGVRVPIQVHRSVKLPSFSSFHDRPEFQQIHPISSWILWQAQQHDKSASQSTDDRKYSLENDKNQIISLQIKT